MQTLQLHSTSNLSTISEAATLAALEGGTDFLTFANYLLEAPHVGEAHGSGLGVENYVRMAYAGPMPTLCDAGRRIKTACAALTPAFAAV
ncbi:hypothetical protein QCE63_34365 [Caballeronia sp. LZ065]|uniref:hypothetical protein n=1 Tax=Caballeronia sp. LZ065 TaxID=3038571 RepID=UPI0028621FFD|nr:hypothetical protein [Caballeronia sp. LZ065]MDR5784496.1 hypothetical protein [Caballeronia sp. LZ065]